MSNSARRGAEGDDGGLGGDEPFCVHGNLLWSELCDECVKEDWAISDAIAIAAIRKDD
jgi:hypothetical protein